MHLTTVTLKQVSALRRLDDGRRFPGQQTCFSFRSETDAPIAVFMDGAPPVAEGMQVTMVMAQPGGWQNVLGWLDHDSGNVYAFGKCQLSLVPFALGLFAFVLGVKAAGDGGVSPYAPLAAGLLALLWFCVEARCVRRRIRVARLLREYRDQQALNGCEEVG